MSFEKKLFLFVLVIKISFLIIFLSVFGVDKILWSDSAVYVNLGRALFRGDGFSDVLSDGNVLPNTIRTPLYPFIVGFADRYLPYGIAFVALLQALVASGIAVYMYLLACKYMTQRFAVVATLLASFEPLISTMHVLIMPETLLVFFLLIFVYHFILYLEVGTRRDLFVSATAFIFALYTKPVVIYLIVIPLFFLIWQKQYRYCFLYGMFVVLLLFPWMYRNFLVASVFDMTTDDTGNICSWELTAIMATKYHVDSTDWNVTRFLPEYESLHMRCRSTIGMLAIYLKEYPKEFFAVSAISAISMLTNDGYTVFFEKPAHLQTKIHHNYLTPAVLTNKDWVTKVGRALKEFSYFELFAIFLGKIFWSILAILAFIGFFMLVRDSRYSISSIFMVSVVLYFICATVLTTGLGVGARLRYPIVPFLLIFAGVVLSYVRKKNE